MPFCLKYWGYSKNHTILIRGPKLCIFLWRIKNEKCHKQTQRSWDGQSCEVKFKKHEHFRKNFLRYDFLIKKLCQIVIDRKMKINKLISKSPIQHNNIHYDINNQTVVTIWNSLTICKFYMRIKFFESIGKWIIHYDQMISITQYNNTECSKKNYF